MYSEFELVIEAELEALNWVTRKKENLFIIVRKDMEGICQIFRQVAETISSCS